MSSNSSSGKIAIDVGDGQSVGNVKGSFWNSLSHAYNGLQNVVSPTEDWITHALRIN